LASMSIPGGGNSNVTVYGNSAVTVGSGNNRVTMLGQGNVTVGAGQDTINLLTGGRVVETGALGHDTINLGLRNAYIDVQGDATVLGSNLLARGFLGQSAPKTSPFSAMSSLGAATIAGGGVLQILQVGGTQQDVAFNGTMTLMGSNRPTEFVGGSGTTLEVGMSGRDTFVGGYGHDTMTGSGHNNVFNFVASSAGGDHVITDFVSGDQLNVDGHSLAYLVANQQVTTHSGNTYISADGGITTIELRGVTTPGAPPQPHTVLPVHGLIPNYSADGAPTPGNPDVLRLIFDPRHRQP
jgi:Ca2+-binding RTX toxin-like protein